MSASERLETLGQEYLAARVLNLKFVLSVRERELLEIKGPCSNQRCGLHYAHSGPCDGKDQP